MYAQRRRAIVQLPQRFHLFDEPLSQRAQDLRNGLRAVGGLVIASALTIVGGQIIGALFGVQHPKDPRYPGGATVSDLAAFFAIGVVIVGVVVGGRRLVHGSLLMLAGAIAFWVAIPELAEMSILFGLPALVNLGTWVANRRAEEHHHDAELEYTQRHTIRKNASQRPAHPVGFF